MNLKNQVIRFYKDSIKNKIAALRQTLEDLRTSAANETKSTAGDKHETALAMLQIEQENTSYQLKEYLDLQSSFERIEFETSADVIKKGSLVLTDKGYFFLSAAMGKCLVNKESVISLSGESPLGRLLLGKRLGETVTHQDRTYLIKEIQ